MARDNDNRAIRMRSHAVQIEDRSRVSITDVEDVEQFNENEVILITSNGTLIIWGEGLHISKLNLDEGQLVVEGHVNSLEYDQSDGESEGGFFSRFFK